MTNSSAPIATTIDRASFSIWSKEDIRKISVKKLTEPKSFEKAGALHPEGLYSKALGAIKRFDTCSTCGQSDLYCPGHYGHIDLSVPVYHPMLVQVMFQMLGKCCLECFHFRLSQPHLKLFLSQLEALNCGFDHLIEELDELAAEMCRNSKTNDDHLTMTLSKKLEQRIQEEKEKTLDFDIKNRPQQRSIVERLSKLFRNFINGHLIKPQKICPNCNEKKITIALHQQSVIVVGINSSKPLDAPEAIEVPARKSKKATHSRKKRKIDREFHNNNDLFFLQTDEKKFLTPIGAREYLRQMWKNESTTLGRLFHFLNIEKSDEVEPVDLFFIDTILVPPPKFRPPMSQRGYSFEGPRTAALSAVMKQSLVVQDLIDQMKAAKDIESEMLQPKVQSQWKNLQTAVNCLYDNEMDKYGKNKYPGLKQLIDKKEGLFRKNMMGKRVNFAARSVISPDPNISVDEIGVPLVFAQKLTYPETVTPWNIERLRQAILNGSNYPGATSVVFDDDTTVSLIKETTRHQLASRLSYNPRHSMKNKRDTHKCTIVNRHLLSGDVLLFNRQPTLHKPSIMAFRARVLPNEKGFRLHYANCKSFNADFDGDEMNAHFPQSELARSEALNIVSVNHQYLVPKDGSPLSGLIQDHVVALCILTRRDQFFDKERYHQLVYCALASLAKPIRLEKPTIMKPTELWTGKQVVTTLIKNCIPPNKPAPSLDIKSKIGPKILNIKPKYEKLSDCNVTIRHGELLVGFIDKSNVGATQYGLVHTCYELYGGETSSALMSAFARLATWYLELYEGFTLGIGDILVEDDANQDRHQLIEESKFVGPASAREALGLSNDVPEEALELKLREAHSDRNPLPMKKLDASMKTRTDKVTSNISGRCLPEGLIRRFPDNNLQMMIQSGAKGGTVNALQISCLLGQIELEGRRVPLSMSGRSLPSFKPYDTSPKAGGFVSGRFLTGIQPQEFFFHCMAGREGLIDTAVKTSRSGYLQRCLIKHLEGLTVHYDQTVRDSCGSVIQFLYGEDGLDIVKSQMLKNKAYPLLVQNYKIICPPKEETNMINQKKVDYEQDVIARTNEIQEWLDKNGEDLVKNVRGSGFLDFLETKLNDADFLLEVEKQSQQNSSQTKTTTRVIGSHHHDLLFDAWYALSFKEKKKWNKAWELCPDPLTSLMNPASHFGVVPESLDRVIEEFVKNNPHLVAAFDENPELSQSHLNYFNHYSKSAKITKHEFYHLCYSLYMKMIAQPGEAVGLLAAQSIGEPSTQMTLNTFHFAGRGEMNVTLGIPRLREILMTASARIATPSMDLPLLKVMRDESGNEMDGDAIEEQAKRVKLAINAVRLSDVLEYVDITEQIIDKNPQLTAIKSRKKLPVDTGDRCKQVKYDITFALLPSKYYKHEFKSSSSKTIKFIEEVFVAQLTESMIKRQKRLNFADSLYDLSTRRMNKQRANGEKQTGTGDDQEEKELNEYNAEAKAKETSKEDESSSDEEEEGENDKTSEKLKSRRNDLDYEEPEDDDLEVGDVEASVARDEEKDVEILEQDEQDATVANEEETTTLVGLEAAEHKFSKKRKRWCHITITLDLTTTRLDMRALIDSEARSTYLRQVGKIQRAFIVTDVDAKSRGAKCDKMIKTEGVSLLSLVKYNHILDLNAIYTNDMHAIANTYGIEAASQAIRRELASVFAVYGIEVDQRHLSLIADYMTYNGSIRGMNRMSMEASASPFQQMSYESTLRYLKWAAILGLYDDIKSPSAALVFGRPTRGGTGIFSMLSDPTVKPPRNFARPYYSHNPTKSASDWGRPYKGKSLDWSAPYTGGEITTRWRQQPPAAAQAETSAADATAASTTAETANTSTTTDAGNASATGDGSADAKVVGAWEMHQDWW